MSRMTKILAVTALALGITGLTVYASIALQPAETATAKMAPAVFTSGGSGSCCSDGAAQHTMAQNALFTPKVNAATQGTCPYTGKTAAMAAGTVCPEAATMASNGACDMTAQDAALTASAAGQCPMQKTATTAAMEHDCSSCPEAGAMSGECPMQNGVKATAPTKTNGKIVMAEAETAN